jgi:hypothetical protein
MTSCFWLPAISRDPPDGDRREGGNPESGRTRSPRRPPAPDIRRAAIPLLVLSGLLCGSVDAETDPVTGLVIAPGFEQVRAQCTVCHSGRLVSQNRADRDGWLRMIRWMQETQGLWPLGDAEAVILDYLADNYAPRPRGRRAPLKVNFDSAGANDAML